MNQKKSIKNKIGKSVFKFLPAKFAITLQYKVLMKSKLNWKNLKTFNEKIQYIKLYDRNPLYTICADKFKAKSYVDSKLEKSIIIQNFGVWDSYEEINFESLPQEFVLKTNHDWAGVYVCDDKSQINHSELSSFFKKHLNENFYYRNKEWAYKDIEPKIFAEKLLKDNISDDLIDYKFFSFNGFTDSVMICIGRSEGKPKFYFFNKEWELLPYNADSIEAINNNLKIDKPKRMNEMFDMASILSEDFPFVRVDLYYVNETIYFGEMTFYPSAGYDNNLLRDTDIHFGNLIDLKLIK